MADVSRETFFSDGNTTYARAAGVIRKSKRATSPQSGQEVLNVSRETFDVRSRVKLFTRE